MHVVLADDHRASQLQLFDNLGVLARNTLAVLVTAGSGANAGGVDVVLERDGDAVQRAAIVARCDLFFGLLCLCDREFGGHRDEGVQRGIQAVDAGEAFAREFDG